MATKNTQLQALPAPVMLSVNLPFHGFYESIWSSEYDREQEQQCEYWQEDREAFARYFPELAIWRDQMTDKDWQTLFEAYWDRCDWSAYKRTVCLAFTEAFAWWLADSLDRTPYSTARTYGTGENTWTSYSRELAIAWEFEELTSPRFYNFETDKIFAKFSLSDLEEIKRRLDAAELDQEASERHTSRSGFISFYDPDWHTWPEQLQDWDYHQLGTLVRAWIKHVEGPNGEDLDWQFFEGMSGNGELTPDVDWPKLQEDAEELAWSIEEEVRRHDPDFDPATLPAPRCPYTLDLFQDRGAA